MLTDADLHKLINEVKEFVDNVSPIDFPKFGSALTRAAKSPAHHDAYLIDINRKGTLRPEKCTYQKRFCVIDIIFRLDIGGPAHVNPDGEDVPCPHLHIYREGFADKWAFPIDVQQFSDTKNLVKSLHDFLKLCNIVDYPPVQGNLA